MGGVAATPSCVPLVRGSCASGSHCRSSTSRPPPTASTRATGSAQSPSAARSNSSTRVRRPPTAAPPSTAAPPFHRRATLQRRAAPQAIYPNHTVPLLSHAPPPRPGGWWPVLLTGRPGQATTASACATVEAIGYRVEREVIASQLRPTSCGLSSSKVAPAAPATTNLGCGQATGRPGAVAGAGSRTSGRARVTSERALSSCETW